MKIRTSKSIISISLQKDFHRLLAKTYIYNNLDLLGTCSLSGLDLKQINIVATFLNRELEEKIYMRVLEEFKRFSDENYTGSS